MDSASLRAFDEQSAAAGLALWPSAVTIAGTAYACTVVRPRQATLAGPFADEPEPVLLTVRLGKALLATAPLPNTFLTWESARWKIKSIRGQEESEATWILACHPAP